MSVVWPNPPEPMDSSRAQQYTWKSTGFAQIYGEAAAQMLNKHKTKSFKLLPSKPPHKPFFPAHPCRAGHPTSPSLFEQTISKDSRNSLSITFPFFSNINPLKHSTWLALGSSLQIEPRDPKNMAMTRSCFVRNRRHQWTARIPSLPGKMQLPMAGGGL